MAPAPAPPTPEPAVAPATPVVDPFDEEEQRALEAEMRTLLHNRDAHDAALAALESQLDAFDGQAAPVSQQVHADAVMIALATMLDAYRSAELLAGRLPLVVDGAFDEMGAYASAAVANHLAAVDDVQVIVVTSDGEVADAFSSMGVTTGSWPDPARDDEQPLPAVEEVVAMCDEHAAKVAAASCTHCARGACLECLVYVPGEAELWCVTCAERARGRSKAPALENRA